MCLPWLVSGCFQAVLRLLRAVQGNLELQVAVFKNLLFDLRLWKSAKSQVQITVANFLVQLLQQIGPESSKVGSQRKSWRVSTPHSSGVSTDQPGRSKSIPRSHRNQQNNSSHSQAWKNSTLAEFEISAIVERIPCTTLSDVLVNVYAYPSSEQRAGESEPVVGASSDSELSEDTPVQPRLPKSKKTVRCRSNVVSGFNT